MGNNVTRRDFMRLTTGFIAFLPKVAGIPGAFLLATPTIAQAEELAADDEYDPAHVVWAFGAWESLEEMNAAMDTRVYATGPDGKVDFRLVK